MKILFIDKNQDETEHLQEFLIRNLPSCKVQFIQYDEDILASLDTGTRIILMLRIRPDDGKGVEILKTLRSEKKYADIYIITWIESSQLGSLTDYFKMGADDCIMGHNDPTYTLARLTVAENNLINRKATHTAFQAYQDLKNMHAQLVQSEKLAGIGRLAAGVAHEINNPLGFVSGNVEALEKYINRYQKIMRPLSELNAMDEAARLMLCGQIMEIWKQEKISRIIDDMEDLFQDTKEGIHRISVIVNGLKNFARTNQQDEQAPFDLNAGIRTTLVVARNELKYDSDVEFEEGDIPWIVVNGGQINQVILNILLNAVYAIREKFQGQKGKIVLKTSRASDGDFVCLSIADNGCGMSEETVNHVFEPFYTTKPVGVGTGLGLGIAYDIINNKHGGEIEVSSKEGEGTQFLITLPVEQKNH